MSTLGRVTPSIWAWAMSMRSNGSEMVGGQVSGGESLERRDRELVEGVLVPGVEQIVRCFEVAGGSLDDDLPRRGGRDDDGIVGAGDGVGGSFGPCLVVGQPPQQDVRVEGAPSWRLLGFNPSLGDRRPLDLIRRGQARDVLDAIASERAGSFA